jgi:transcription initiation factor IIE alpha subunit
MDRVICPQCEYQVGLGMASDPGKCPRCDEPLMLTGELRAYSGDDLTAEVERQRVLAEQRSELPLV